MAASPPSRSICCMPRLCTQQCTETLRTSTLTGFDLRRHPCVTASISLAHGLHVRPLTCMQWLEPCSAAQQVTALTLAAALESPRSSTGGNPSARTLKAPLCCSTPSATTIQFSAQQPWTPLHASDCLAGTLSSQALPGMSACLSVKMSSGRLSTVNESRSDRQRMRTTGRHSTECSQIHCCKLHPPVKKPEVV